jgi:penicillin-insensitive murein endopeptidase
MSCRTFPLVLAPIAVLATLGVAAAPVSAEPIAKQLFGAKKVPADLSARSIGSYARGCLAGGRMLPITGPAWEAMKLQRNRNWGHPELVAFLERFAKESKEEDGWPGLLIGDLSQPRGGPMLTGHRSHQVGLDADIWYKPKPDRPITDKERADSWSIPLAEEFGMSVTKNWKPGYVTLLRRAASYPETARIFVHPAVKKALCDGAGGDRGWLRKVRPWWKHNFHFHVRLRCPDGAEGCADQAPPPAGDGCGPQLNDWMKLLEKAEKWSKEKPKDPKKPVPRKELRMADLPQSCRGVLEAEPARVGRDEPADKIPLPEKKSAAPAPARAVAAKPSAGPALPWLKGIAAPAGGAVRIPLPDRKPQ